MSYRDLVQRIIADGRLTAEEYKLLLKTANEDGVIDAEEREGILKVLGMKQRGELKLFGED
jgi:hypothetical protein